MSAAVAVALPERKSHAAPAILVGGLLAGALDLCSAFVSYGVGARVIAAGLLGRTALQGGVGPYALGIFLQFFIATSAAALFYAASTKLAFLKEHPIVCGLFYGIAVFLVMNLIVVPLRASRPRPIPACGAHPRFTGTHVPYRLAHFIQRPPLFKIKNTG